MMKSVEYVGGPWCGKLMQLPDEASINVIEYSMEKERMFFHKYVPNGLLGKIPGTIQVEYRGLTENPYAVD